MYNAESSQNEPMYKRCCCYDCFGFSPVLTGGATSSHATVASTTACIQKYSCLSYHTQTHISVKFDREINFS